MAQRIVARKNSQKCGICLKTCTEPRSLGCNHNFCSNCLQHYWTQNNTKICPNCRRKSSGDVTDFTSVREKVKSDIRAGVCSSHPAVPCLFCKDEARALCPVCEFSQHKEHTVVSMEQAGEELKQQLHSQLETLVKRRREARSLEQVYWNMQQHSDKQAHLCERQIRAEFDWLQRFLKEEQELQLSALKKEQQRQTQTLSSELGRIKERLVSLDQSIEELQKHLQRKSEDLIHTYKPQKLKSPSEPVPHVRPGLLLNQAKITGNLSFRVWKKMRNIFQFSPIILDPNTAHPTLHLSMDLNSVRHAEQPLERPENPERFSKAVFVLGSEGFSSGTHCWDMEVEDHPNWIIGAVKGSADRNRTCAVTAKNGFWCLSPVF